MLYLALLLPVGVLVLLALGAFEVLRKRTVSGGTPMSANYANELTAFLYGSKRFETDQRDSWSMLREEDAQGAPPGFGVDLDQGTVTLPGVGVSGVGQVRNGSTVD